MPSSCSEIWIDRRCLRLTKRTREGGTDESKCREEQGENIGIHHSPWLVTIVTVTITSNIEIIIAAAVVATVAIHTIVSS